MKAIFLVFHGFAPHNGISKKISYQVEAMRACGVDTRLCYFEMTPAGEQSRIVGGETTADYGRSITGKIRKRVDYSDLTRYIRDNGIDFIYMRSDHNANPFLTRWLKKIRKQGVKTVMEIPTYPYDPEYAQSPLKRKMMLMADKVFRRCMARQLYRIVTFTDFDRIFGVSTINISNGIDFDHIPLKQAVNPTPGVLSLMGVADIHFWHGFDRVIAGMAEYYKQPQEEDVRFLVVGGGVPAHLEMLKDMTVERGLTDKVSFLGPKAGPELDEMFTQADMGIGSLARHRCGIDSIKTLKNREYAARGIPFVYSETDSDFDTMPYVMKAPDDESPLDIDAVVKFYRGLSMTPSEIRESITGTLSWQHQMQKVIDSVKEG